MKTETTQYNPFDYLETQEEINEYLTDAFTDEDPRLFLTALGYLAKKKGMADIAKITGLNRENLYKTLSGNGNPRFSTVVKVSKALGVKLNAKII
jgi:probable addiction module antidote protein